jgi:predicted methyltransferase
VLCVTPIRSLERPESRAHECLDTGGTLHLTFTAPLIAGADPARGARHPPHAGEPHHFTDAARWSRHWDAPERDGWQKPAEVLAAMQLRPGMAVCDIGAGTGYFLPHLSAAVGPAGQVLALDIEPAMVRHMQQRVHRAGLRNVTVRQVSPVEPALRPAGLDRILLVNTWHHIADRVAYARKLRAALRPGGSVFIVDYTLESPEGPPRAHRLAAAQVVAELRRAGLRPRILTETLPRQYIVQFD